MRSGRVRHRDEQGQVAIIVALTLALMLAFGALVVDVGLNWAARGEAQSAADAAALAGAALLPDDPPGAADTVKDYLDNNVPGLSSSPADPQWADNGKDADGEITCYAPPAQPAPGAGCKAGAIATAIQVITPPLTPTYAFASILGRSSNSVKALAAAVATPPEVPPCALCVLGPGNPALTMSATNSNVTVTGGGVVVNADSNIGNGHLTADFINVVGQAQPITPGSYTPAPTEGAAPVADPYSALPTPAQVIPPHLDPGVGGGTVYNPGVYDTISVLGPGTVIFEPGVYVIKGGLHIGGGKVLAHGVVLYFTCASYPTPCNGQGADLQVTGNGSLDLSAATTTGEVPAVYQHLAVFFDRANSAGIDLGGGRDASRITGTIYARSAPLRLRGQEWDLRSMTVVGTMEVLSPGQDTIAYRADENVPIRNGGGGLIQ
jgi:hypothetical protein